MGLGVMGFVVFAVPSLLAVWANGWVNMGCAGIWLSTAVIAMIVFALCPDDGGISEPSDAEDCGIESRALRLVGVGAWERDLVTNRVRTSAKVAELFGLGSAGSTLLFEDVLAAIHPDDRQRVIDAMNKSAFEGGQFETEFRIGLPDGSSRWLAARGGVVESEQQVPTVLAGIFEDVTTRRHAQEARGEKELLYGKIAENVPGIVYQMLFFPDGSRSVPYISNRVEDVFGVTRDQIYQDANILIEAIHPFDRKEKEASAARSIRTLTRFDWTGRIVRPDGSVRWIHALCMPAKRPDGAILWDGVMLDVTEVKHAELEHIATKNRLSWLLSSSPVVIYSCSGESPFPITYLSDNAEELLGIPVEPSLADPLYWQKRIHPDDADMALTAMEDVLRDGTNSIEYRIRVASGEYRWIREEMRRIADGDKSAIVGMVVDVTEHRLALDALRLSDERFLAMSNASPLGVLLTDPDGTIVYVNNKLEQITGVEDEGLNGGLFFGLVQEEDAERVRDAYYESVSLRKELSIQCRLQRPDHRAIWCSIKTAPMFDGSSLVGFVGTVEDVTERFDPEMQSEQSRIEAERANQAKSAFLTRISHELRTPLHAMLGFAQLLQMGELDGSQRESVDNILRSGHHLLSLIRDVLDIARAESGELGVQVSPVSLYPIVEEAVQMLSALAREKDITIESKLVDDDHVSVLADRQRLRQVVINILSNSIKYNRREGTVSVSCEVRADGLVVLAIRDSGPGIPSDKVDRLFTPFDRLGAESTAVEGTGLGLTLTKRLIEAMGGSLELESDERTGTTVQILLRYVGSRQFRRAAVDMPDDATRLELGGGRILLIEDNQSNINLMQSVLQSRPQYSLEVRTSGKAGWEAAAQTIPDLVLLDMNLPDIAGVALLEKIRGDRSLARTAVIVISATASERQIERTRQLGAFAYLTKPLDVNELLRAVDDALGAVKQ